MLFPAIDFEAGHVVQLVQGERRALQRELAPTLELFQGFPCLQIIDLDAAKGEGDNGALVERCCAAGFRVRVGGGIRTLARARQVLAWGAEQVIVSSAAFKDGRPDLAFLAALQAVGRERIILAVDSRGGQVAIAGWRQVLPLTTLAAIAALEPFCSEFLYTNVDTEGLMQGIPLDRIREIRQATPHQLTIAGGISTLEEIRTLDAMRCHSVLGMAIYTGKLSLDSLRPFAGQ